MCDAGVTLTRESICVTCLSQDRKLFPINDSKSHALFLDLSDSDKLCWECNFFVLKMAAFRSQAARAQALLASALQQKNATNIKTLSRLTTTPVEVLGASIYTSDPLHVYVKAEPFKPVKEESLSKLYECPVEDNNSNSMFDESDDESVSLASLPVKPREASGLGDIANASLKSLLSRKSASLKIRPMKKFKKDTVTVQIEEVKDKEVAGVKEIEQTAPIDPDNIYKVTVLSEEELLKWRERKKNMDYYTSSIGGMSCKQCIEPFTSRKLYTAHVRRHKEDYGPFACRICGLHSDTEKARAAHTAQHYRLLSCNVCGYEWDSANAMRRHCHVAHGVPVTVWDCDQCERQFPTKRQQSAHMICHRVVSCRQCGKQVRQNNLKKHKIKLTVDLALVSVSEVASINSLSSLIMTPIHLEIMETSDPLEVEISIKSEIIKEECENTLYGCPTEDTCNIDNVPSDEFFEEIGDESSLPVLNNQTEAKGDEATCGEAMGDDDDDDNASLKSLLNKKNLLKKSQEHLPKYSQHQGDEPSCSQMFDQRFEARSCFVGLKHIPLSDEQLPSSMLAAGNKIDRTAVKLS
ncbi:hypothetical protein MSG28_015881 [Choristoneura fumiferana]|uniref:Uncharacterized protein n=1 Tax=Choristoneura fumiferana TaxID=7141 RepID=A0ACC0K4N3_CHOFU|nr:hypothetical protein MSG28_015881 [Choristoneura fumiferana]